MIYTIYYYRNDEHCSHKIDATTVSVLYEYVLEYILAQMGSIDTPFSVTDSIGNCIITEENF